MNGKTSSILDYCIISTKLFDTVEDCTVLNEDDMTSDHLPVLLKLKMKRNITNNIKTNSPKIKSYNFDKADWGGFKNSLP